MSRSARTIIQTVILIVETIIFTELFASAEPGRRYASVLR